LNTDDYPIAMASPATTTDPPIGRMSYAQSVQRPPSNSTVTRTITPKKVWRRGTGPRSVFFPVDETLFSVPDFFRMARQSFPVGAGLGTATHRENSLVFIEMFLSSDDLCERACNEGVSIGTHTVFATRPLSPDAEVTTVFLTKLPCYVPTPELEDEVRVYMSQFGRVLETTFFTEPNGGWFQGRGKVVLDTAGVENNFEPLVHNLHLPDSDASFHATWKSMPVYCRYCHENGHNRLDCPVLPANSRHCFTCNEKGHMARNCPRLPPSTSQKKRKMTIAAPPATIPKQATTPKQAINSSSSSNPFDVLVQEELSEWADATYIGEPVGTPLPAILSPATAKISTAMDVTMAETISSSTTGSASMMLDLRERPTSPMFGPSSANTPSSLHVPSSQESVSHLLEDTVSSLAKRSQSLPEAIASQPSTLKTVRRGSRIRKAPVRYE
jgi:hypothetical protein